MLDPSFLAVHPLAGWKSCLLQVLPKILQLPRGHMRSTSRDMLQNGHYLLPLCIPLPHQHAISQKPLLKSWRTHFSSKHCLQSLRRNQVPFSQALAFSSLQACVGASWVAQRQRGTRRRLRTSFPTGAFLGCTLSSLKI